jgi:hypothetical protein
MEETYFECHGHMLMDGGEYRDAVKKHERGVNQSAVRANMEALRRFGVTYFRDGGDALGVSRYAAQIAEEYGIDYVTPAFAIYREGRYGGIVGYGYDSIAEYAQLISRARREGCDFIKLMFSGIMYFDIYGHLSCPPLPPEEIKELVRIAHERAFALWPMSTEPER